MASKKKSQFIIRPAVKADIDPCLQINHSQETENVWQLQIREDNGGYQIAFQTLRLPRPIRVEYPKNSAELRRDLANLDGVLVAEIEGTILGYVQVQINPSDNSSWVRNLVVDEPYRRHRIGRTLLEQAKVWAQLHQANHITLETTIRSYPTIRFLQGRGLLFCGFNDRYYASQDIAVFFGQNL